MDDGPAGENDVSGTAGTNYLADGAGEDGASDEAGEDSASDEAGEQRPDWWRAAEAAFEEHGLVEYRPPRFGDGTVIYDVVSPLEAELGVDVDLAGYGRAGDDEWFVRVDGTRVAEIDRQRRVGGRTVYDVDPDAFEALVRDAVDEPHE